MKKTYVFPSVEAYLIDQSDVLTVISGADESGVVEIGIAEYGISGDKIFNR